MRTSTFSLLAASLLASSAAAFKDSSPLLIWSSSPNAQLADAKDALTSGVIAAEEVYGSLSSLGCDWDALAVVHVEDLHQSRISSLRLPGSKADLHIPYLIRPTKSIIDTAVDEWAKVCGADIVSSTAELNGKSVVQLDVDSEVDVATLASTLPASHLILLTGSRKVTKPEARKERPFPSHSSSTTHSAPSSTHTSGSGHHGSKHNSTVPTTGPLLDRVQILTTPIITGVLITFLIFIPIILFGVYALVGIQVPPRMMEIGKGLTVNKDRKDQ